MVEDADAGVEAALAAGMRVIGVGTAAENQRATLRAAALDSFTWEELGKLVWLNLADQERQVRSDA